MRRGGWLAVSLALVAGAVLLATRSSPTAPSDTDARIEYYQARLGGPGTYPAYARLGLAYLEKARETGNARYSDDAEQYLEESLRFQRNYEALRGMSILSLARHKFPEAQLFAEEAAAADPGDLEAQGTRFDAYLALGDDPRAETVLEGMLRSETGFVSSTRLANLRQYRGHTPGALEAMRRACSDAEKLGLPAEKRAWCQVRLGSLFVAGCDGAQAERAYQQALEIFPDYFLAREHLAELRAAQDRPAEAMALYAKLLMARPDPHVRLALADLYDSQGMTEDAAGLRAQALTEMRRSAESSSRADWRPLALLLLRDDATAAEGLHWAERDWENRRDVFAADALAWAYFRKGRPADAVPIIERALATGTKEPLLLLHAAEIRLALKERPAAEALLRRAAACPLTLGPAEKRQVERIRMLIR